jgi:hypothetical protein
MSDDPAVSATPPADATHGKQPWHPPLLQEVDYSETEAGAGFNAIYDGPYTYTSSA